MKFLTKLCQYVATFLHEDKAWDIKTLKGLTSLNSWHGCIYKLQDLGVYCIVSPSFAVCKSSFYLTRDGIKKNQPLSQQIVSLSRVEIFRWTALTNTARYRTDALNSSPLSVHLKWYPSCVTCRVDIECECCVSLILCCDCLFASSRCIWSPRLLPALAWLSVT